MGGWKPSPCTNRCPAITCRSRNLTRTGRGSRVPEDFPGTSLRGGMGAVRESLGPELGMYQDPYARFGHSPMRCGGRSVLVVGHRESTPWGGAATRPSSTSRNNSAKTEHDIVVEIGSVHRHARRRWPTRSASLKLKELRALVSGNSKSNFDIRGFHARCAWSVRYRWTCWRGRIRAYIALQGDEGEAGL